MVAVVVVGVGAQSGILAFDNSIQIYILCLAPEHPMQLLLCENHKIVKTSGSNLYFIRRWVLKSAVRFLTTCTTSTKFIWHLKIIQKSVNLFIQVHLASGNLLYLFPPQDLFGI